ncbi:SRPBCC family protein [Pedobacter antarcticus]|uniref:SRPBCC family protein n=1 Tax=Pedobacter antarcticus TaxID=34086 RepID=UPI00292E8E53|nr:SRPBCC family protein [Pedobacter antarcticus]
MKAYQLQFVQKMPVSLEKAWDFFSSPLNLAKITPEEMAFKVTSNINPIDKMYAGMIITYKVSPVAGIKLNWMTEITQVEEQRYFIDEQRFGPYQFWHHQHHFKSIPGGVEMTDVLTYGMPLGFLGTIANSLFVANKLQQIFKYRKEKVDALFGKYEVL